MNEQGGVSDIISQCLVWLPVSAQALAKDVSLPPCRMLYL